jgi:hypothetical protein
MVTDISEARLVMLFTEGLTEPLRGWVKAYKPTSLQDAVSRARDLQESVSKPKFTPRPTSPRSSMTGEHHRGMAQDSSRETGQDSSRETGQDSHRGIGQARIGLMMLPGRI